MNNKWLAAVTIILLLGFFDLDGATAQTIPGVRINGAPSINTDFYPDFAEGVQHTEADPSPSVNQSNVNNYINQDEQINIQPNDGTVRVLRTDQKNLVQEYVTRVIPVRNADVAELVSVFRTVAGKEGGRAEVIRDKVNKEYFIQVVAPSWQIPWIEDAVAALDEPWVSEYADGSADYNYHPRFREAALIDRIASQWGGTLGASSVDTHNNAIFRQDEPYRIEEYAEATKFVDVPEHMLVLEGAIYELNLNDDKIIGLDYIAWKNGPGRNLFSFLLAGGDAGQTFSGASSLFDPNLTGISGGRVIDTIGDGDTRRRFEAESRQEFYAANFLLTAAYLDFLQSKGKAKVLARPSITVRSGSYGTWSSLDQIVSFEAADIIDPLGDLDDDDNLTTNPGRNGTRPDRIADQPGFNDDEGAILVSGSAGEELVSNPNGRGYADLSVSPRTVRYKNLGQTGLFLNVLPLIGTETTEMTVDFAQANLNGYTPQGLPIIDTRTYLTTVRVADGQPLVVGAIHRAEKVKSKQGAPFLSSIPIVGWAFGGETNINRENDLVMVLMPRIYTSAESDVEMPAVMKRAVAEASSDGKPKVPRNPLGFDQWLLDGLDQ